MSKYHALPLYVGLLLAPAALVGADDAGGAPAPSPTFAAQLAQADELRKQGYYDRAAEAYELLRSDAQVGLSAGLGLFECNLTNGWYDNAAAILADHAKEGEKYARWQFAQARLAHLTGRYDDTLERARQAIALDKDYCPARLLLAQTLELLGKEQEALSEYDWFDRLVKQKLPTDAENLTAAAEGFYRISVLRQHPSLVLRTRHVLNRMLQPAYVQLDKNYWPARVASADLLAEKFNVDEARKDYEAALAVNHAAAEAHIGIGWLELDAWNFEQVDSRVRLVLDVNQNHAGALRLEAACRLTERKYAAALDSADLALKVNPRDVEALALKASAKFALGDPGEAAALVAAAEAISPRSMRLHAIIADALGGLRQYAESEKHYEKAIANELSAARPRTELGMMYMQWGEEAKARTALDAAWKLDPFNERTKNTLELLQKLESFGKLETEHFEIRFDAARDELIATQAAEYLESIYADVCGAFNARLEQKTIIEIFPTHEGFAVRITGKPWLATVGACTGRVIAIDAPRSGHDLPGPYNFAHVLRHEFTHTVTLGVTHNRIPHWFTEGLAVVQEHAPRSYDWKRMLADAIRRDRLFTLETVDWGFMRPKRSTDRTMAYAQSEWMCEYLIATYGADVIGRMLAAFDAGKKQPVVFAEVVGTPTPEFDKAFATWARAQAATWGLDLAPPEDTIKLRALALIPAERAAALGRLARAQLDADERDEALESARQSVAADAKDNPIGLESLVRVVSEKARYTVADAERSKLEDEFRPHAERLLEIDPRNRHALAALAELHFRNLQFDRAETYLLKLREVAPDDPMPAGMLATLYEKREDFATALPLLLEVAATDEHDAGIPLKIAEIYKRQANIAEARRWYQQSLWIDPLREKTHARLAELQMQAGDTVAAVKVYETLCRIAPQNAEYLSAIALAYHKLGDKARAREFAERAVAVDPKVPASGLLHE
jgi:Flp pilus assembly protein TadD